MDLSELNNDQVHAVAVHLASAEAIIHTQLAVDMRSEGRRYRIRVGRDATPVQVFSRRSGDWQLDAEQPLVSDTEAVVFVDFASSPPEFYVVPATEVRDDVRKRYEEFLERVGTRPNNPASRHYALRTSHIARWRSQWGVLQDVAR